MAKCKVFDRYYEAYDEWFLRNDKIYKAELDAVGQLLPENFNGIEIGVGTGKFAVPLGIKKGIDPSDKMALVAERLGIDVDLGSAENLPYDDASFDLVMMITTICFVDSVKKTFSEAFRVLENGGMVLIGFVDKKSDLGKEYLENREKSRFYKDASFFTTSELLTELKNAGFTISDFRQTIIPNRKAKTILSGYGDGAFVVIKAIKEG